MGKAPGELPSGPSHFPRPPTGPPNRVSPGNSTSRILRSPPHLIHRVNEMKERTMRILQRKENAAEKVEPKRRPVHSIRLKNVRASVWQNESEDGPWFNVTLSRLYRSHTGEWQSSDGFSRD